MRENQSSLLAKIAALMAASSGPMGYNLEIAYAKKQKQERRNRRERNRARRERLRARNGRGPSRKRFVDCDNKGRPKLKAGTWTAVKIAHP